MIFIKKIISILLVMCTLFSFLPQTALALSWDGSSAGGSTNAVNGSSKGYVIRSTNDSECVVGYRFSALNSDGSMKGSKVIDVFRNTSNGNNAYSTSAKFSTKYNKKQIIANKNAKLTTTYYNQTNCFKESAMGFYTTLPNPNSIETWQSYNANINVILSTLGIGSVSNLTYGEKVIVEPIFDVCLAGEYQALTVSEIAFCGRSVLGSSSNGGSSNGTSSTWGFIANYTNRIWPNKLYTPDGQGLWTGVSAIASSTKETFENILTKGYGAGIAYTETKNKTYTIKFNGNGNTGGSTASMSMIYGVAKNLNANGFTKTGNYFSKWNTKSDGTGTNYENQQSVKNLTSTHAATVNLYARWKPYKLSILYSANGGSINSTTYYLDSTVVKYKSNSNAYIQEWPYNTVNPNGLINNTTFGLYKTGYVFKYWNTKADGTGTDYNQDDGTLKATSFKSQVVSGNCAMYLYAKWQPITYTIKFNGNGNTGGSTAQLSMTYNTAKNLTANGFTKTGYIFNGWNTKSDGTGTNYTNQQSVNNLTTTNGATINLYAKWKPITYTIKFNGNGNTGGSTAQLSMTYDVAKNLTANGFTKTGYIFNGWNTKSDGTGTSYSNQQSVKNLTATNNATVNLYAQWKPIAYTIKFNGNGNTGGSTAQLSMTYNTAKNLTANGFTKTGYIFNGWNTKSDGTGTSYSNQQSVKNLTATNNATVNLYAQWKPIAYTIKFNGNGNTGGSTAQLSMTYNTAKNLTANGFTKTGYIFNGWNTKSDGTGTSYSNQQSVKNLTATNNATVNLYAIWKPITYTIKFYGNGSTAGSTAQLSMTYDVAKNLTSNGFNKTGYEFSSWNTKADGTGISYGNQQSVKNLTTTSGATINLYAQWSTNSYTIAFNGNGHTGGSTSSMSMKFDETKTLTVNGYTKTGYSFAKWNTKSDGTGTSYVNKQEVKNLTSTKGATINLYAIWTPNKYTIAFNGNENTGGSTTSMSMTYNVAKNLTANGFTKTGHYFTGWNTKADGTGTNFSNQQSVKNLATTNGATINLYAQWKPYTLDVVYNVNGGSIKSDTYYLSSSDICSISSGKIFNHKWTYNNSQANGLVNAASFGIYRTGYTFNKWGTNTAGGTLFDQDNAKLKPTDINSGITSNNVSSKLYAIWTPNKYTITFNGNGNTSGSMTAMSMTYNVAKNLTTNGFTKTGHCFTGWNTKADGTGISYTDKQSVKNLTSANGATINLYAQWKPYTLDVVYNANGGSIKSDTYYLNAKDIYVKETAKIYNHRWIYNNAQSNGLVNAATFGLYRTGYTFNKWSTNTVGGTLFDQDNAKLKPTDINSGITSNNVSSKLYAQWIANKYTIAFNGNGHTGGSTASMSMTYDIEKNLLSNKFTKTGYLFDCWNTKADGSGTKYTDGQLIKNLISTNGATITLYAQWKPITYRIMFIGNGATSGTMDTMTISYDVVKSLTANAFKKTGYDFNGWNTKIDGSGTKYTDKQSVKNLATINGTTIVLYAQWKINPVLAVDECDVYSGNKGNTNNLFGITKGNVFDDYVCKKGYPTIGDTVWYNVHFPLELENITVRQYVRYKGGSWVTRDVTLSRTNSSSQWFPVQFSENYKTITASQQNFELEAKIDWIDSSGNVLKSGNVNTFYIPIKPVVYRQQVKATGYEGTVVAYNGRTGSSGKLYSGQHINIAYNYAADNTWNAVEYLRGSLHSYKNGTWQKVYTENEGYDAAKNRISISNAAQISLNSSLDKYTVPITNQNELRFKLETWWASDKTNTKEDTWYSLPVVKPDVELSRITLVSAANNSTLNPNNLRVGQSVNVRYTYKNNTDTNVYVEGFRNDKTQIFGVYVIPANSSITVNGYSFTVPNERNFNIWGGVYLEGMGIYNTDYETNQNNNALILNCKVNHPLTLQPIMPNADYRESTEVITSYWLNNSCGFDYIPSDNISIKFCMYKGDELILNRTKTQAVVPAGRFNLIYIKWRVPTGLNYEDIKITAEIIDDGVSYNKVSRIYSTIPYANKQTPDTQFEKRAPQNYNIPPNASTRSNAFEWWEYVYDNGEFVMKKYYSGIEYGTIEIKPENTQIANNRLGTWEMKSGYGIKMELNNEEKVSKPGMSTAPIDSYTAPQYCIAYYPEYDYLKTDGKITTLRLSQKKWIFPSNGEYGNVHFTPLWYPNGNYIIRAEISDMWTPGGMAKSEYRSNKIIINDSAYDDWHIGR